VAAAPAPVEVASLPKTASNLGLIGLAGMMLLGAGLLLSGFAKKTM
jgi:LPXTG-motif cell wall-anchored protein